MSMLKFKVNGIYKNGYGSQGERFDYECEGLMPVCDEEYYQQNANRLVGFWIKDAGYKERFEEYETVYIDKVEEVDEECPIDGKNIKDLDWLGLQYLACKHHLNAIPLHQQVALSEARVKACKEYIVKVNRGELPAKQDRLDDFPDLILSKSNYQVEPEEVLTNEEILNSMQQKTDIKEEYTLEELKAMANDKGIAYHPNIGYAALHRKLFG